MENSFQTSFIPKKPISAESSVGRSPTSIITVFFVALLVIMSVVAGGLFLYKNYLGNKEKVLQSSLSKVSSSFQKETIDELELFDKRTTIAKQILVSHIVLSPLFTLLGNLTIPAIQYTKFEHQMTDKGFIVQMSGTARDYKSIALQADTFNTALGRSFKNVVFSNLTKDVKGNVVFDVEFTVDASLLSYEKSIAMQGSEDTVSADVTNQILPPVVPTTPVTPSTDITPTTQP